MKVQSLRLELVEIQQRASGFYNCFRQDAVA